jgi:peptidoglycan/xylan/chitin deacetylase (PgdA/CDA1 family)
MRTVRTVPVVMYHAIEDARSPISLAPARFAAQMGWLKAAGVSTWTVAELAGWLEAGAPPTAPVVVLTFDDGFRSVLRHALPVLARHGFRATVYLVTGHVGGKNDWTTQPAGVPRWELLTWAEVRELAAAGMDVGAHSVTHPWLPALPAGAIHREVAESRAAIEDALGRPARSFAYPYGGHDARVRQIVRGLFPIACGDTPGRVARRTNRSRLPRIEVHYVDAHRLFRGLTRPAIAPWLHVRGVLRWARATSRPAPGSGTARGAYT